MSDTDAYSFGYSLGFLASLLVPGLIFWFAGRWGWIGVAVRIVCGAFIALRLLSFLASLPH
jgi:hypothetical protein